MTTDYQRMFNQSAVDYTADFQKQMDAHRAKAAAVRENAETLLGRISERKDLTPEAARAAAARIYKPACEQMRQMLDQHIEKVTQHKQKLAQKAFGSDPTNDPAKAMMRRQARQQAATLTDPDAAKRMLAEAKFDGDVHLARATAAVAYENGWHDVVDAWNSDGSNNASMRSLIEMRQLPDTKDPAWRINTAASYAPPMPGVLEGMKPHEISRAAEADIEVN
ncbi:hypothetical protein HY68_12740 [Streptomyces sp. AcH 505]|uniref:hypothetical protein n=1 Tax=Streptomyces sp. AcH 505 TaxID=352211 RepID=UPI0005922F16|nr:hypothetical protein HY68_12740 [Streptomyces sp. AcH 505]